MKLYDVAMDLRSSLRKLYGDGQIRPGYAQPTGDFSNGHGQIQTVIFDHAVSSESGESFCQALHALGCPVDALEVAMDAAVDRHMLLCELAIGLDRPEQIVEIVHDPRGQEREYLLAVSELDLRGIRFLGAFRFEGPRHENEPARFSAAVSLRDPMLLALEEAPAGTSKRRISDPVSLLERVGQCFCDDPFGVAFGIEIRQKDRLAFGLHDTEKPSTRLVDELEASVEIESGHHVRQGVEYCEQGAIGRRAIR